MINYTPHSKYPTEVGESERVKERESEREREEDSCLQLSFVFDAKSKHVKKEKMQ